MVELLRGGELHSGDGKLATMERKLTYCGDVCHQLCLQTLPAVCYKHRQF